VFLENEMAAGRDVLLDLDVQGARQLSEKYPDTVMVFIMPPSLEALRERLVLRGTDSEGEIEKRLANAQGEIAQKDRYHHIVINDRLYEAIEALVCIILRYRHGKETTDSV